MVARNQPPRRRGKPNGRNGPPAQGGEKHLEAVRLANAMRHTERMLTRARRMRRMFVAEYAGPYYGPNDAGDEAIAAGQRTPLNLLLNMADVTLSHVGMNPRANVTTKNEELTAFAAILNEGVNHRLDELQSEELCDDGLLESLFGLAIFKTGIAFDGTADVEAPGGYLRDEGKSFTSLVDMDDYLPDLGRARTRDQMGFEGHRFHVPYEWAMDSGFFSRRERAVVERMKDRQEQVRERTSHLAGGKPTASEKEFVPRLELIEAWLPTTNETAIIDGDLDSANRFLRLKPFVGPETGPYDVLTLNRVPGNVLPLSRAQGTFDLHLLVNELAKKVARQAERQKDLTLFDSAAGEEAGNIRNASDGDMVPVDNVDRYKQISYGGASEDGYNAVAWFYQWYNRMSGNLDVLGGMQSRSPTLGQEQMLMQSAGTVVSRMRKRNLAVWKSIIRKHAWYLWQDDSTSIVLQLTLPNGVKFPAKWTPEAREGDFLDYSFGIEAYGLRTQSPEEQAQYIERWVDRLMALAPLGAPQGAFLDVGKVGEILGKKLGIAEVDTVWHHGEPMQQANPNQPAGQSGGNTTINAGRPGNQSGEPGSLASKPPRQMAGSGV